MTTEKVALLMPCQPEESYEPAFHLTRGCAKTIAAIAVACASLALAISQLSYEGNLGISPFTWTSASTQLSSVLSPNAALSKSTTGNKWSMKQRPSDFQLAKGDHGKKSRDKAAKLAMAGLLSVAASATAAQAAVQDQLPQLMEAWNQEYGAEYGTWDMTSFRFNSKSMPSSAIMSAPEVRISKKKMVKEADPIAQVLAEWNKDYGSVYGVWKPMGPLSLKAPGLRSQSQSGGVTFGLSKPSEMARKMAPMPGLPAAANLPKQAADALTTLAQPVNDIVAALSKGIEDTVSQVPVTHLQETAAKEYANAQVAIRGKVENAAGRPLSNAEWSQTIWVSGFVAGLVATVSLGYATKRWFEERPAPGEYMFSMDDGGDMKLQWAMKLPIPLLELPKKKKKAQPIPVPIKVPTKTPTPTPTGNWLEVFSHGPLNRPTAIAGTSGKKAATV